MYLLRQKKNCVNKFKCNKQTNYVRHFIYHNELVASPIKARGIYPDLLGEYQIQKCIVICLYFTILVLVLNPPDFLLVCLLQIALYK